MCKGGSVLVFVDRIGIDELTPLLNLLDILFTVFNWVPGSLLVGVEDACGWLLGRWKLLGPRAYDDCQHIGTVP